MEIGRALKYYRALHHLTQSDVAALSGINEKYLGRIERNESVPTIDKLEQLCLAFDIRTCDLLMAVPEGTPVNSSCTNEKIFSLPPKIVYYCNCCGCTFQSNLADTDTDDIRCPECDCIYDPEDGYIEKSIVYQGSISQCADKKGLLQRSSPFVISAQLIPVWRI